MTQRYDVVVIGAGPAGEIAAERAVRGGLSAVVVESDLVGGECSYWACMPSKALLRPGEALRAVKRTPGARAAVTGEIDVAEALKRRDAMTSDWDDKWQVKWLDDTSIDLIRGHGRIAGTRAVTVHDKEGNVTEVEATKAVVLATGSAALVPPVPGIDDVESWNNRDITALQEAPRRLIILGGGVVGVEMAQAWKDLGSDEVTIVEMLDRLLPRQEPFAGEIIARVFTEEYGIGVRLSTRLESLRRENGELVATLSDGDELRADEILIAAGRRPLSADIGLETVGLEPGRYVEVDDQLRAVGVDGDWLYAVGDINGRSLLTHDGKYQGRICGDVICGEDVKAYGDIIASPRVVFTDPHVAAVGLTESQAREQGINVRTVEYGFGAVAGAATMGEALTVT
jgi:dihydrolipoamide dehydrogenase